MFFPIDNSLPVSILEFKVLQNPNNKICIEDQLAKEVKKRVEENLKLEYSSLINKLKVKEYVIYLIAFYKKQLEVVVITENLKKLEMKFKKQIMNADIYY